MDNGTQLENEDLCNSPGRLVIEVPQEINDNSQICYPKQPLDLSKIPKETQPMNMERNREESSSPQDLSRQLPNRYESVSPIDQTTISNRTVQSSVSPVFAAQNFAPIVVGGHSLAPPFARAPMDTISGDMEKMKTMRPFKAYLKNQLPMQLNYYPLPLSASLAGVSPLMPGVTLNNHPKFRHFRGEMLQSNLQPGMIYSRKVQNGSSAINHPEVESLTNGQGSVNGSSRGNGQTSQYAAVIETPVHCNSADESDRNNGHEDTLNLTIPKPSTATSPKPSTVTSPKPSTVSSPKPSTATSSETSTTTSPKPSTSSGASASNSPQPSTSADQKSTTTNGRKRGRSTTNEVKDDSYWERRKKNNEAAKRSRDARRAKEDEIAIRAAFLHKENIDLQFKVASLKRGRVFSKDFYFDPYSL